ncbi:MAG: penicillin-binding protein 2 [Paludibacteraceae bacterium]|nr:penicillin-binding protein 2 [Paludibacteraceae bacterium]
MSEKQRHTILRFAIVFVVIALMFLVVVGRIFKLQTTERDKWLSLVENREANQKPIPAIRGNIYDCDGRLLATSIPQYSIHMDTRVEALHMDDGALFWTYVDSIAEGLSRIVGDQTKEQYRERMVKAYTSKRRRDRDVRLSAERISYTQLKEIKELPLVKRGVYKSGFYTENLNLRKKPFNTLSSRTIGNISLKDGEAKTGIEKRYDSYLRGTDGVGVRQRVAGSWQYVPIKEAVNGYDVHTTLDANLIDICETELRKRLEHTRADWGCVALMDVHTGEIKAISNLDRGSDEKYYELANHAVIHMEPGSTFKTISLMAALDDGKISFGDSIEVEKDGWWYHKQRHRDAHPADTTYSIRQALAVSSNIALAKIVTNSYNGSARKFVKKLKSIGLCDSVDYTIPGAQQALITIPNDTVTLAKMAYGYSVELSPLQMLMFYNGIANGGKMVSPLFVKEIRNQGEVVERFENTVVKSSLCSKETLAEIKECLHDVVWDNDLGTASVNPWGSRKAQSALVSIAGKTGTAQVLEGGYQNTKHRISFVGYFPEENPQYSCICVIHGPKWPYDAGMDCGSVVRNIAEKTMAYAGEYVIDDGKLVMKVKE